VFPGVLSHNFIRGGLQLSLALRRLRCLSIALGLVAGMASHARAEGQGAFPGASAAPVSAVRSGIFRGRLVNYAIVDGRPVLEGDILLDHVGDPATRSRQPNGVGTALSSSLWPKVAGVYTVPYVITAGTAANINKAVTQFNATFKGLIQFVPHKAQADYVDFNLTDPAGGSCYSYIGDIHSGAQGINGAANCSVPALLHEMGHAVGLYHEQSRMDRDSFVNVYPDNLIAGQQSQYVQPTADAQDVGSYDFASIMMYYPYAFSSTGKLTMESKPAGIEFGLGAIDVGPGYSAGDIDIIRRLYGAAPKTVTIASLPSGLTVTVDGVAVKTPKAFNWALNSTHTLSVGANAQTIGGESYIYGRWSDQAAATHSIAVKAGGGTPATPKTSPALTVYTASFVHLVRFAPQVSFPGGGTVTGAPAAKAYAGASGAFYPARLPVSYTAMPAAGFVFAGWLAESPSAHNPVAGTSSDFVFANVAQTPAALTTILTNPAGVEITVDGQPATGPSLFAWQPGGIHQLSISDPYGSPNTRSALVGWSDKGAATHNITAPSTSQTFTATVKQQFKPYLIADPACAATLKIKPATSDGFINSGTAITVTGTATPGWVFAGWTGDLAGLGNPAKLTLNGERRGTAIYNLIAAPLKIKSVTPASLTVGSGVRSLTLTGTGFTGATAVFVNGEYRPPTSVSATKIVFPLNAPDVAKPNALGIQVQNIQGNCFAFDGRVLFVTG
jgi:hypothetical protein